MDSIRKASAARHNKVPPASPVSSAEASTSSLPSSSAEVPVPSTNLNSFRIMNLENLSKQLQLITTHAASCGGSCTLEGETYRAGLACIIQAKCGKCHSTFSISSSPRVVTNKKKKFWTINLGAVLGQMATGGGASHLQQVMASVGAPSMSKSTFTSTERYITEEIKSMLANSMIEAGKEERRFAIENDSYFQGIPAITVIGDGGWSKRSHKHSYTVEAGY